MVLGIGTIQQNGVLLDLVELRLKLLWDVLPTIYDNVIFDANSFSGSQTVTIVNGDAYCNNINWSGSNQGLLTGGLLHSGDIFLGNLFIKGDADFSGARGIAANLMFVGNGSNTISSGSFFTYNSPAIKIMGTGTHTLSDHLTASSSVSYLQHTAGTFNTGRIYNRCC